MARSAPSALSSHPEQVETITTPWSTVETKDPARITLPLQLHLPDTTTVPGSWILASTTTTMRSLADAEPPQHETEMTQTPSSQPFPQARSSDAHRGTRWASPFVLLPFLLACHHPSPLTTQGRSTSNRRRSVSSATGLHHLFRLLCIRPSETSTRLASTLPVLARTLGSMFYDEANAA